MSVHPQDQYDALEWAIAMAQQSPHKVTPLGSLYLRHLCDMRDQAKREAGR